MSKEVEPMPASVTLYEVDGCDGIIWTDWPDYDSSYKKTGRQQKYLPESHLDSQTQLLREIVSYFDVLQSKHGDKPMTTLADQLIGYNARDLSSRRRRGAMITKHLECGHEHDNSACPVCLALKLEGAEQDVRALRQHNDVLANGIKDLTSRLPSWVNADEQAPTSLVAVWAWVVEKGHGSGRVVGFSPERGWNVAHGRVTHWMPLPEPPTAGVVEKPTLIGIDLGAEPSRTAYMCKRCNVEMLQGVALKEGYTTGVPDFDAKGGDGQTMFPSGKSSLVTVAKCPDCGYSVTV